MKRSDNSGNSLLKILLVVAGTLSVGLGILGIFLPLLPTTPFLLLAAACYVRSSERLYHRLITNRWTGEYIANYRAGKGMPIKAKIGFIALLWVTLACSAMMVQQTTVQIVLALVAFGVPLLILSVPTLKR